MLDSVSTFSQGVRSEVVPFSLSLNVRWFVERVLNNNVHLYRFITYIMEALWNVACSQVLDVGFRIFKCLFPNFVKVNMIIFNCNN